MSNFVRRLGMLAVAIASATACSPDRTAAPESMGAPSAASADLLGTVTSAVSSTLRLTTAPALLRTKPLEEAITISKTIGNDGGVLSIPEAGVTVLVPRGALESSTQITMTARAGSLVAYDFAPHGITFQRPLVFSQSLKGTTATVLQIPFLKLGYYEDASLLGKTTAVVSELIGGLADVLSWTFTAPIKHFSGYVVICGRSDLE